MRRAAGEAVGGLGTASGSWHARGAVGGACCLTALYAHRVLPRSQMQRSPVILYRWRPA